MFIWSILHPCNDTLELVLPIYETDLIWTPDLIKTDLFVELSIHCITQFCLPKRITGVTPIVFWDFISVLHLLKAGLLLLRRENLKHNFQFQIFLAQSPGPLLLWGETVTAEDKEYRNWVKEETFTNSYCWRPFEVILIVVALHLLLC